VDPNSQHTTVAEGSDQYGLENNDPVQWRLGILEVTVPFSTLHVLLTLSWLVL